MLKMKQIAQLKIKYYHSICNFGFAQKRVKKTEKGENTKRYGEGERKEKKTTGYMGSKDRVQFRLCS